MMEDAFVKLNPGLLGKNCIQQGESSFYRHIGFKIEEKTSKMVHLQHSFI